MPDIGPRSLKIYRKCGRMDNNLKNRKKENKKKCNQTDIGWLEIEINNTRIENFMEP